MTMIMQVSQAMQTVLVETAQQEARTSGLIERKGKVTGANFVQTLVFGWMHNPGATLEGLCQTGAAVGLAITPQGLEQRFTRQAARFLYKVLQAAITQVVKAEPVAVSLLKRFKGVYVEDSSIITLPDEMAEIWAGCGGSQTASKSAVKLQVRWDMLAGELDGPHLLNGRTHDRVATQQQRDLQSGSLRLTDLGYWKLADLEALALANCYWLSRLQSQTKFYDTDQNLWHLHDYVRHIATDTFDISIQLGAQKRLTARLIGTRVPKSVAEERRRKLIRTARRKGQTISPTRLALCDWTVLVTNVSSEQLAFDEAFILARLRWQIELLFKLWKSHGQLDKSRSAKPWRILCEFYAKLIGLIIQHWLFLMGTWQFPNRSFPKAVHAIRQHALFLALGLQPAFDLSLILLVLQACFQHLARINKSRSSPRAFQLLLSCHQP